VRRKPIDFVKVKQEAISPALEVTARLYKALLEMEPFTLLDGTCVSVKAYTPPRTNNQGEAECGVDIVLPDGHLEFMIRNTGWGKSFAQGVKASREKDGRRR
jgi:hypothetical protein